MRDLFNNQIHNKFFWTPILLAFGAALYFIMPFEPNIKNPLLAFTASALILLFGKMNFFVRAAMLFFCGFLYAAFYTTTLVSTPILTRDIRLADITANVTNIDVSNDKTRLVLSVPAHDLRLTSAQYANIKVNLSDNMSTPSIGDLIKAKISVFPPSPAEAPESFDYSRWAFFNNLTATGFISEYEFIKHNETHDINSIRNKIHNKANSFLTDGLVLGYKNAVPKIDREIWTTAGVGHIWSISGFHMTLIGGWLFAFFYFICRSIGFLTRRIPSRIAATICAWILLFGYVCISGLNVATLRAFLMTSLLFIALLLGRSAISMRNICIAFLILFFINPHFVTQPGFQLSFAAIFGLIWFFGDKKFENYTPFSKIINWLYIASMTAIIATMFTLPFIATHFSSVPLYSLIGNLVLLPIFSILIMPLVVIGTLLAIFNIHFVLNWATGCYEFALNIAKDISHMPFANIHIPHIPDIAFAIFILGFAMLIFIKPLTDSTNWIFRKINYILFIGSVIIGSIIISEYDKPVFYITTDHELIGMVYDGKLEFNKARAANHYFAFDAFRKLNNEPHNDTNIRRKCPDGVCIYKSDKFTIAYIQKFLPLQKYIVKLCHDNDIDFIVSYFKIDAPHCAKKILNGGFVMYKSGRIKRTPSNRWWHNPHE